MLVSKEGNLVTLINVFETTPEQQQDLTPAIPLRKETKETLSARPAFRNEAGKKQESEVCI